MEKIKRDTHTIDATGRILGKLAAEIAALLRGKHKADFVPNRDMGDFVVVKNADKVRVSGRKFDNKMYYHHTGYLGGLKATPYKKVFEENPGEVIRKAVYGMLAKNKLRAIQIKRLKAE